MRATRNSSSADEPPSRGRGLKLLVPILAVVAGVVLLVLASLSDARLAAEEVFQGQAPPGDTLVPVNQTGYGVATFRAPDLPCPLFIFPLSPPEYANFLEDGQRQTGSLNCERPNGSANRPVSHFLLQNLDPTDSLNYTLEVQYFRLVQRSAWAVVPGAALLLTGTAIVILWLLQRGLVRLTG